MLLLLQVQEDPKVSKGSEEVKTGLQPQYLHQLLPQHSQPHPEFFAAAASANRAAAEQLQNESQSSKHTLGIDKEAQVICEEMPEDATSACQWVMGSVSRPLEQLMFSESPRRKSRTSRIIHELLDTPPDLSHTVETKKPDNACSVQAPAAKKKRMTGETNSNTHHAKVCRQQQDPPHEQVDKPVQQSLLRTPNARGHAIWFLQTPVEEIDRIDRIDVGAAVKISRLSKEEETAMNAALETALCALRRKGITRAGPAAAAQLLNEFSHAVGANLTGLCCVPLDGDLHSALPAELLGDPAVSAARLPPPPPKGKSGALAGAALHRAKQVVSQILDSLAPVVFKIGITCTPFLRWRAYEREGYQKMHLLHVTEEPGLVQMMEAALISEFQGRAGCRNVAKGGEGPVGQAPYFAYLVVVSCGDGVGILPKRTRRTACKTAARKKKMPPCGGRAIVQFAPNQGVWS